MSILEVCIYIHILEYIYIYIYIYIGGMVRVSCIHLLR